MKLSIIVPHYKESLSVVLPLLDSIKLQGGIDFDSLEVLLINDGSENAITEIKGYPYKINIHTIEHKGVCAARNFGLDHAKGDYVMFCDCDDMFVSMYGLHMLYSGFEQGHDVIISAFIEEHKTEEGYQIIRREHDTTFVHGKAYRREYLLENDLRFNEKLSVHEDGAFNTIAFLCTESKTEINTPFYIWKWRDDSVACKGDKLFVLKTYDHVMKARDHICHEAQQRGFISEYMDFVAKTVIDSYYDFQKPDALDPENEELVKSAKKAFKEYYLKYRQTYHECNIKRIGELMSISRAKAVQRGLRIEQQTIREFVKEIMEME